MTRALMAIAIKIGEVATAINRLARAIETHNTMEARRDHH